MKNSTILLLFLMLTGANVATAQTGRTLQDAQAETYQRNQFYNNPKIILTRSKTAVSFPSRTGKRRSKKPRGWHLRTKFGAR